MGFLGLLQSPLQRPIENRARGALVERDRIAAAGRVFGAISTMVSTLSSMAEGRGTAFCYVTSNLKQPRRSGAWLSCLERWAAMHGT